jgi:beta-mannanase
MITWEPWSAPRGEIHTAVQPDINLQRIVEGAHDDYIRSWARSVAAYRQPVLLRLAHEMNGYWYPWGVHVNGNTPELYVRAWRHVHRIFDTAGADNVSWVWSINNLEGPPDENHEIDLYYPGSRWVDWVSTSGFNWGTAYSWSSWRDADQLYGDTYRALARFRKPIMISEIGTTTAGGDARAWIRHTFRTLRTDYPKLKAVLWYDDIDGGGLDFRLQGQTEGALGQKGALGPNWLQAPVIVPVAP